MFATANNIVAYVSEVERMKVRAEQKFLAAKKRRDWLEVHRQMKRMEELERLKKRPPRDLTDQVLSGLWLTVTLPWLILTATVGRIGWVRDNAPIMRNAASALIMNGTLVPRVDQLRIHWIAVLVLTAAFVGCVIGNSLHVDLRIARAQHDGTGIEFRTPLSWGLRYDTFAKTCAVSIVKKGNPWHATPSVNAPPATSQPVPVPAVPSQMVVYKFVPCVIDTEWW